MKGVVSQMSETMCDYSIIDEIYLENEDKLRDAKLSQMLLQVEIKNSEQMLQLEEEKKDPNRNLFHTVDAHVFNSETDRMREELFEKKEQLEKEEALIAVLEDKKQRLHAVKKALYSDVLQKETIESVETTRLQKQQLLVLQEQDRNRIAADLHDSTVQSMTALLHKVELIERFLDIDRTRAFVELNGMKDNIRVMIQEMREIIYDLRPMSLENLGLWMSIKEYLDVIQERNGIQVQCRIEEEASALKLEDDIEINIFRMIQEAANNSAKHAQASLISVNISRKKDLVISITDDGIGMKESEAENDRKFGLSILQERAQIIGASLQLHSGQSGTEINIVLPLT